MGMIFAFCASHGCEASVFAGGGYRTGSTSGCSQSRLPLSITTGLDSGRKVEKVAVKKRDGFVHLLLHLHLFRDLCFILP